MWLRAACYPRAANAFVLRAVLGIVVANVALALAIVELLSPWRIPAPVGPALRRTWILQGYGEAGRPALSISTDGGG